MFLRMGPARAEIDVVFRRQMMGRVFQDIFRDLFHSVRPDYNRMGFSQ
jgi:hypothetical protein